MRKYKNSLFYFGVLGVSLLLMYWFIVLGAKLEIGRGVIGAVSDQSYWKDFIDVLYENIQHPIVSLIVQIVTIVLVARLFGWLCKLIGQPSVIGEILAGIALGPSLVGAVFPEFSAMLFPIDSLENLNLFSQIGLILFMFVIGMELDLSVLKNKAQDAVIISHASIVIPFTLGVGLSYFIYTSFAPQTVSFLPFALFMGISMSITAFPVLARIVQERGIHKTRLGTVVLTCAAADDITAWCLLAAVIAIAKAGSFISALYVIALAVVYVVLMIKLVRPFLARIGVMVERQKSMSKAMIAILFLILLISACITEIIGIHALFGAFMAGAIMPVNSEFRHALIGKIEDLAVVLFLPLFFVYTGLRTEIGLLNDPYLWKVTGLIVLVAVVGKFVGSAIAARFVGQSWKDSLSIGALMNTRGLMELVVLNIGYDLGVLDAEIFAMMVIMALVTTFMTGPLLDLFNKLFKSSSTDSEEEVSSFKVLISFANPKTSTSLLKLANGLFKKAKPEASLAALHFSPSSDVSQYNIDEYEKQSFAPILQESKRLDQAVTTLFRSSSNIEADIAHEASDGGYDLLLLGVGSSIYEGSILGRILGFMNPNKLAQIGGPFDQRVSGIVAKTDVPIGVLINRRFTNLERIFIPILSDRDFFLLRYAELLIKNSNSLVTILNSTPNIKDQSLIVAEINNLVECYPNHVVIVNHENQLDAEFVSLQSLILTSEEGLKIMTDSSSSWIEEKHTSCLVLTNFPKDKNSV